MKKVHWNLMYKNWALLTCIPECRKPGFNTAKSSLFININVHGFRRLSLHTINISKADTGPANRARAPPPPSTPVWKYFSFVFIILNCKRRIFFNCSQHAMCTICILFSILTTKAYTYSMREGTSKQSPDPKNHTAPPA